MTREAPWHWLEPVAAAGAFRHRFCGAPQRRWPDCPNCRAPLLHYASFDPRDPRLGLREFGRGPVPCVFCWRCALAAAPLHYRVGAAGELELLAFRRGDVESDFPYADYPIAFAESALELVEPTARELAALEQLRAGALWHDLDAETRHLVVPRHRAGLDLAEEAPPACALCSRPMRAFAIFGDANLDARGFSGNETVEVRFFACPPCATVGASQRAD